MAGKNNGQIEVPDLDQWDKLVLGSEFPKNTEYDEEWDGCTTVTPVPGAGSEDHTASNEPAGIGLRVHGPIIDGPPGSGYRYRLMLAVAVRGWVAPAPCGSGNCVWLVHFAAQILAEQADGSFGPIWKSPEADGDPQYGDWHGLPRPGLPTVWDVATTPPNHGGSGKPPGSQPNWRTIIDASCPDGGSNCTTYTVTVNSAAGGSGLSASASMKFCCNC